jgi:hypothetical protein
VLPLESVAEQVTFVRPTAKRLPGAGRRAEEARRFMNISSLSLDKLVPTAAHSDEEPIFALTPKREHALNGGAGDMLAD